MYKLILAAALFAFFLCRASVQKKRQEERENRPPQKYIRNKAEEAAITKFVRTFDYSDWCGTGNIICARKDSGYSEKLMVCFEEEFPSYRIAKMIRLNTMETLEIEPNKVELTEEALSAFYAATLTESLSELQELANDIARSGSLWVSGAPYNNGEAPNRKELRILSSEMERMGFKILALRFSDGFMKLGIKER